MTEFHGMTVAAKIKSSGLEVGERIVIKHRECGAVRLLIVGNCTPYETVTESSDTGWDWDYWDQWLVLEIEEFISNIEVLTAEEIGS